MAKIVSEKREIVAPLTSDVTSAQEPKTAPAVALLGIVLTAIFLLGAVAMVVLAFQNQSRY